MQLEQLLHQVLVDLVVSMSLRSLQHILGQLELVQILLSLEES